MAVGLVSRSCLGCLLLAVATQGFVAPFSLQARGARTAPGRQRRAARGLSMIVPQPEWGYVCEEIDDFPDYIPDMGCDGESKSGATPEAYPANELPLDDFFHGGAFMSDFHDIPSLERPCYLEMKRFIDQEGLTMLPEETEMLERDIQLERRKRAQARKERYAEEPDEDLVDDTLDDVPIGTDVEIASADVPPPPIDFDDNDGYDDGYDSPGDSSVADVESSALF